MTWSRCWWVIVLATFYGVVFPPVWPSYVSLALSVAAVVMATKDRDSDASMLRKSLK
jgi:hypothetical protein